MEAKEGLIKSRHLYQPATQAPDRAAAKALYEERTIGKNNVMQNGESIAAKATTVLSTPLLNPVLSSIVTNVSDSIVAPLPRKEQVMELFGSFFLSGQEFALPADCIHEVVNFPEKVIVIPLSPTYLEGMFTLRGMVIPLVNLARLFDASAATAERSQKIAIVDYGKIQIGLLFDGIGEILRVSPEQHSSLHYAKQDVQGVVAGTIQLGEGTGSRLLQILDHAALLQIENIPYVLERLATSNRIENNRFRQQTERRQCVSFHIGPTSFAFEMSAIREIIKMPELRSSILDSKICLGGIDFRGGVIPVVNFTALLKTGDRKEEVLPDSCILVCRIADVSIGFFVDSVDDIVGFFSDDVLPIPLLSKTRAGMYSGCIVQQGKEEIILLDHQDIFSRSEIVEMNKGHANVYAHEANNEQMEHIERRTQRKVYITFSVEHTYAVEIKQIREIIDFSGDMIKPPNMPYFMRGIMNLRRQLITVVDLRSLYGMQPLTDMSNAKILIIDRDEERYGLLVDAVVNIVTVPDSNRYPVPKIMRIGKHSGLRNEMEDVIEMAAAEVGSQTISVFQTDVFLQRLARDWPDELLETGIAAML